MPVPSTAGTTGGAATTAAQVTGAPPAGWPAELVTGPGIGPALYLGPGPGAPAIGYVSPGVIFRLEGAPQNDRIPVVIDGPMQVHAWLATARMAGLIQQRGRVGNVPGYVGPNDVVRVLDSAGKGLMKIELRPPLSQGVSLSAMQGVYPANRIAARPVDPSTVKGPTPGTTMLLPAGQEVPVYDRPGGKVVATLPALQPPVSVVQLIQEGAYEGVRVGTGPYLVGFVNVPLTPAPSGGKPAGPRFNPLAHPTSNEPLPIRLNAEPNKPLWRVAAGTQISFDGRLIAVLDKPALAREMARHEPAGEVDVFVAVNDDVAVRGIVPAGALQAYK